MVVAINPSVRGNDDRLGGGTDVKSGRQTDPESWPLDEERMFLEELD